MPETEICSIALKCRQTKSSFTGTLSNEVRAAIRCAAISCAILGMLMGFIPDCRAGVWNSDFVRTIDHMKRSIAPVVCIDNPDTPNSTLRGIAGTAFFISDTGVFLTPAHVIDVFRLGQPFGNCGRAAIDFPKEKWQGGDVLPVRWFQFAIDRCAVDGSLDIAKCRTTADLTSPEQREFRPTAVHLDVSVMVDGTPVAFSGFPLGNAEPISSVGIVAGYLTANTGVPFGKIIIDKAAWPGASGSPIFLNNGDVVGMVVQTGWETTLALPSVAAARR